MTNTGRLDTTESIINALKNRVYILEKAIASSGSGIISLPLNESDVTNLVTDLASKASLPLAESDVTNLVTDLAAKIPNSIIDAKGDLIVGQADNVPIRLAVGTNGMTLMADSTSAGGVKWASGASGASGSSKVWYDTHTWTIPDTIAVASGDTDFIPGFYIALATGQSTKIARCRYKINSGTSATVKLQKNGSDLTGFTGISVTTTSATTDPADQTVADNDLITLVVTAVSGTPKNLSFTVVMEQTI